MPESPTRSTAAATSSGGTPAAPARNNLGSFLRNLGVRGRTASHHSTAAGSTLSTGSHVSSAASTPAARHETATDMLSSLLGSSHAAGAGGTHARGQHASDGGAGQAGASGQLAGAPFYKATSPTNVIVDSLLLLHESVRESESSEHQDSQEILWAKRVGQAVEVDASVDGAAVWLKCETLFLDPARSVHVKTAGLDLLKTCVVATYEESQKSLAHSYNRQIYYDAVRRYVVGLDQHPTPTLPEELQALVAVLHALTKGGRDVLGLDGLIPLLVEIAARLTDARQLGRIQYLLDDHEYASTPLLDPNFATPFVRLPPEMLRLTSDPRYSPAALLVACHRFSFSQIPPAHLHETMSRFIDHGLRSLGEHDIVKILEMIDTTVKFGYIPPDHLEDVVRFVARVAGVEGRTSVLDIGPDGQRRTAPLSDDLPALAHKVMRNLLRSPANQALRQIRSILSLPRPPGDHVVCPTPLLVGTLKCLRKAYSEFEATREMGDAATSSEYFPSLLNLGMIVLHQNLLDALKWKSEEVDSEIFLFLEERFADRSTGNRDFRYEEWEMLISILENCTWHIEAWESKHNRPWTIETAAGNAAESGLSKKQLPSATSKSEAAPATVTTSPFSPTQTGTVPSGPHVLTSFSLVITRMLTAQATDSFKGSHLRFFDFLLTIARHLNGSAIISFFNFYKVRQLASPGRMDWIDRLKVIVRVFFPKTQAGALPETVRAGRRSAVQLLRDAFASANGYPEYLVHLLDEVLYDFFETVLPVEQDPHIVSNAFALLDRIMQEAIRDFQVSERPRKRGDRLLSILAGMSWQHPPAFASSVPLNAVASTSSHPATVAARSDSKHTTSTAASSPDRSSSKSQASQVDIGLSATQSLIYAFYHCISGSDHYMARFGVRIFQHLLALLSPVPRSDSDRPRAAVKTRLATLQCLLRLRADQRHRLYSRHHIEIESLAEMLGRVAAAKEPEVALTAEQGSSREKERGRRTQRPGAAGDTVEHADSAARAINNSGQRTSSRSRTRLANEPPRLGRSAQGNAVTQPAPLWQYPDQPLFSYPALPVRSVGSRGIVSFDHIRMRDWSETASEGGSDFVENPRAEGEPELVVLPVSEYLEIITRCLLTETNWDLVSYILCAFPNQLANKHFACGPRAARQVQYLRQVLCEQLNKNTLGDQVVEVPSLIKRGDMQAAAYQWLATTIAYRDLFSREQQNEMVVTFTLGLSKTPNIAKPSIHAMTMACYEFEGSMSKYLTEVLGALVRIMSTVNMPVHILELVASIGHIKSLYANFTEDDYKKVFLIAIQYLSQHYESLQEDPSSAIVPEEMTKALAHAFKQYVFLLSYYVIALWYTIIPVADRPRYTSFIVQRLVRANEGMPQLDPATEVSLDMLARLAYTIPQPFTTADARSSDSSARSQSWVVGQCVMTLEWKEGEASALLSIRRPSGTIRQVVQLEEADMEQAQAGNLGELDILQLLLKNRDLMQVPRSDQLEAATLPAGREQEAALFDADPAFFSLFLSPHAHINGSGLPVAVRESDQTRRALSVLDTMPHIDFHKIGVIYVGPGQTTEQEILRNTHGSSSYMSFLDGLGKLIRLKDTDTYTGGLDREADFDGKFSYIWSDQIQQVIFHVTTLMPTRIEQDPNCNYKKRHIGNDYVKVIYNDSDTRTPFDIIPSQFNFVNIVVEPHTPAGDAWKDAQGISNNSQFFRVSIQQRSDMPEIGPLGPFKMVSTASLPRVVRELGLHANLFAQLFLQSVGMEGRSDRRQKVEYTSTWRNRLQHIQRFKDLVIRTQAQGEGGEA